MVSYKYHFDSGKLTPINKQQIFVHRNPLAQMEEEKREHDLKMKKMESEMEQVIINKIKYTIALIL